LLQGSKALMVFFLLLVVGCTAPARALPATRPSLPPQVTPPTATSTPSDTATPLPSPTLTFTAMPTYTLPPATLTTDPESATLQAEVGSLGVIIDLLHKC
jgi:hypothetical protein